MRKLLLLATAVAFGAVACSQEVADDEESDQDVVSIDVSKAKVVEAGRFVKEGHAERTLEASSVTSLRMNGFGKTRIQVTAKSADGSFAPVVAIEGPIPGKAKVVASKVGRKAGGASLDVVLEERGAYRILVGTSSSFKGKAGAAGAVVVDADFPGGNIVVDAIDGQTVRLRHDQLERARSVLCRLQAPGHGQLAATLALARRLVLSARLGLGWRRVLSGEPGRRGRHRHRNDQLSHWLLRSTSTVRVHGWYPAGARAHRVGGCRRAQPA